MKKLFASVATAAMLLTSSLSFASPDISSGFLQVEGVGGAGQTATMGYRAAKIDAYRNLLEEIGEVNLDSETTVQNSITTNDLIKTKVNGVVKGAKEVRRFKDESGQFHVIITVPVYGDNSLAQAVLPEVPQVPFPVPAQFETKSLPAATAPAEVINEVQPVQTDTAAVQTTQDIAAKADVPMVIPETNSEPVWQPNTAQEQETAKPAPVEAVKPVEPETPAAPNGPTSQLHPGPYTGVVIDCSGMDLQTTMAPGVFTADHQLVYGQQNFSYQEVISRGYVGYAKSADEALERAGANPLIVKAVSLYKNVSPVVSDADAAMIARENQKDDFLSQGKMVFIR